MGGEARRGPCVLGQVVGGSKDRPGGRRDTLATPGCPGVSQVEDDSGGPGAQEGEGREEHLVGDWPLSCEAQMQWEPLCAQLGLWALSLFC